MAVALESAGRVRQKARIFNLDPSAQAALKAFFLNWAQYHGNADLQLFAFSEADCDAAGGTALLSGAATLQYAYVKKNSSATDAYFKVYDDATDDTTAGDQILALPLLTANETQVWQANSGIPLATGIVVTQHTTSIGTTDADEGGSGFLIVSA